LKILEKLFIIKHSKMIPCNISPRLKVQRGNTHYPKETKRYWSGFHDDQGQKLEYVTLAGDSNYKLNLKQKDLH